MRTKEEIRAKLVSYLLKIYFFGLNEGWEAEKEANRYVDKYFRWLSIDNSTHLNEAESIHPKTMQEVEKIKECIMRCLKFEVKENEK